jgi:hypothetical protein
VLDISSIFKSINLCNLFSNFVKALLSNLFFVVGSTCCNLFSSCGIVFNLPFLLDRFDDSLDPFLTPFLYKPCFFPPSSHGSTPKFSLRVFVNCVEDIALDFFYIALTYYLK